MANEQKEKFSYTSPYNISISIPEFFDHGFAFKSIHMIEKIGGELAHGKLKLFFKGDDDTLKILQEQNTGTIELTKEGGNIYIIPFFITNREFKDNDCVFDFYCVPSRDFYTTLKTTTWDDITNAITSLYPGAKDIRCESDVNSGVVFNQQRETDMEFLSRLCSSFKYDIVYSFGFEGLMIKDTIGKDHTGEDESSPERREDRKIWGGQSVAQMTDYKFPYNNLLYESPLNPWQEYEGKEGEDSLPDRTELESKNCCCMRTYNEYRIMGKEYYQALANRRWNLRYLDSNIYTDVIISSVDMPMWKIGDVVYYSRRENIENNPNPPFDLYLVKSNEVFFSADGTNLVDSNGLKFSWTTRLIGLKQGGETLPQIDPIPATSDEA